MARHDQAPHADTDPRRGPDPDRVNIPEGLRREPKPPYGPKTGRTNESRTPEESRPDGDQQAAKKD